MGNELGAVLSGLKGDGNSDINELLRENKSEDGKPPEQPKRPDHDLDDTNVDSIVEWLKNNIEMLI